MKSISKISDAESAGFSLGAIAAFNSLFSRCDVEIIEGELLINLIGGNIYLCESKEDIDSIVSTEGCLSEDPGQFDLFDVEASNEFYCVSYLSNNAGGDLYLIPILLAADHTNLMASLPLSGIISK